MTPTWQQNEQLAGIAPGAVPLVYSDFKNGVYTVGGEASTLADIWEANPDWNNDYDAADVVAGVGLRRQMTIGSEQFSRTAPAMKASPATPLLNGYVALLDFTVSGWQDAAGLNVVFSVDLQNAPDFTVGCEMEFRLHPAFKHIMVYDWENPSATQPIATFADGQHRIALSFTSDELAVSMDGGAVVSAGTAQDFESVTNLVALFLSIADENLGASGTLTAVWEKIVFYDPADYTVGSLPGLSAL